MIFIKVLELFSGTQSISKEFRKASHETFTIDFNDIFQPPQYEHTDLCIDILEVTPEMILEKFGKPDVIWASPDCFTEGTLVWTDKGYKPIEKLELGDMVLTHKNRYMPIYRTIKKKTDRLCDIKISGSEIITTTENHPFYVRKKKLVWNNETRSYWTQLEDPEWVEVGKLTKDYRVGIPINNNSKIPKWNGVEKVITRNQFGCEIIELENKIEPMLDNENFWWLIGRYMGDGTYYNGNGKYQFEICCNKDNGETDEIKMILDKLLEFNYNFSEKDTTNVFAINRKELVSFVEQFGKGSYGKKITDDILNLPKNLLKAFLEGYLSADAHFDKATNCYKITTISKELAYGLQKCILKVYGKYCSMCTKDAYAGEIQGRTVNCKKQYILNFYTSTRRTNYLIENDYAWVNVKDVETYDKESFIYNLSVEDDESYTVNNFSVHNCTTYSIAAISHHRIKEEDGNLAPKSDYAKICDKVNQHMLWLIKELNPTYWFIENPRGGMRKMNFMKDLPRYTISYCQYNNPRVERVIWGMQEKKCPKCGEIKDIGEFYKNKSRRDGLSSWCKQCSNESHKNYVENNKEHMREYGRKKYAENPEKYRATRRKSNIKNAESIKEARKIYYQENKEKIAKRDRQYYIENKEKINEVNREYYQKNKDLFKVKAINRKARVKYISDGSIKLESLKSMYEIQDGKCAYCGDNLEDTGKHLDHIIPISRGGKHTINNVHWTCPECNLSKGSKLEEEWLTKERMKPTDIWTNHPNPKFKPMCKNGDPCHTPAPRGSKTGTQGLKNKIERARIPQEFCEHIVKICEESNQYK